MNAISADTSFFVALLSRRDIHHATADRFSREFGGDMLTTQWVLLEVANYFAASTHRAVATRFIDSILSDRRFECVEVSAALFTSAWQLYRARPDKSWSLTDCLSFDIMNRRLVTQALTADHHFEQAGFEILLK